MNPAMNDVFIKSFQPTYEELKPSSTTFIPLTLFGFQPTYEELKRNGVPDIFQGKRVSSLPMRN